MKNDILFVKAADCAKSPANVRKRCDPAADAQLEANIAARGILQNLIGLPVARKKGHFRITAGGRRLDCVHRLIEKGVFAPDYLVPVMPVAQAGDAIELSLAENFFKLNMNPADACRAFQDIIETEKKAPADIAKRFGLTERFVLGRLRLAGLAEPVFEALRDGGITLDVAMAYASTSDTARQAAIFAELANSYHGDNVNLIRRQLQTGSYKGADPKALFVGRDAYAATGGRFDSDLFADEASETWLDGTILDQLAEAKLAEAAAALRDREGFAEVRATVASHVPYDETWRLTRLVGDPVPLGPDEAGRRLEIEAELAGLEAVAEAADGYTEEQADRIEQLEEELDRLGEGIAPISSEQRSNAIAYVVLSADGEPRVHEQFYVAPVTSAEGEDGDDGADGDNDASSDENGSSRPRYSQRLSDEMAMMKTELIAVHVASDPHFALDLGNFFMVDAATRKYGASDLPTELRATAPTPRVHEFSSGMPAAESWSKLCDALDRSWIGHDDAWQRYDAFCALDDATRAAWLGWAIARTLQAVPADSRADQFLNHIGRKLGIDVAAWWRPTARNFFDRISKPAILALLETIGGGDLKSRYATSRKCDLAASAEKLFAGQIIVEAEIKQAALAWLPDPMRVDLAATEQADDVHESPEASESDDDPAAPDVQSDDLTTPLSDAA